MSQLRQNCDSLIISSSYLNTGDGLSQVLPRSSQKPMSAPILLWRQTFEHRPATVCTITQWTNAILHEEIMNHALRPTTWRDVLDNTKAWSKKKKTGNWPKVDPNRFSSTCVRAFPAQFWQKGGKGYLVQDKVWHKDRVYLVKAGVDWSHFFLQRSLFFRFEHT